MQEKNSYMGNYIKYVSANVISMIGLSLYILVDTFFISRALGSAGLAALNIALPIYNAVNGVGLMLGIGAAARYIAFRTVNNKKDANRVFMTSILMWAVMSVIFVSIGLLFTKTLASLLGADEQTYAMTYTYMKVIFLFSPAFMLNNIMSAMTKNDGAPRLAMLGMLAGSGFNMIFDYIFIFPMKMGMLGAVLATGFSPVVGILLLSGRLIRKQSGFTFHKCVPGIEYMKNILVLGLPSMINEMSGGIVLLVFNLLLIRISGNLGLAAYGIVVNVYLVVTALYTGLSQGVQPLMGGAYATGDRKGLKIYLKYALITIVISSLFLYAICFVFASPIAWVFNGDKDLVLQKMSITGIRIYFTAAPFMALNILFSMYFVSLGRGVPAQLITILRGIALVIPFAFLMSGLFGLTGIWFTLPLTEFVTALISIWMVRRTEVSSSRNALQRR